MRAKKAKKSARSIRYLLYADQRLQKISLRRISERLKRAKRPSRSRPKNSVPAANAVASPWAMVVVGVIMCVVAAGALIAAREPAPRRGVAQADAPLDAVAPLENEAKPSRRETRKAAVAKPPVKAATRPAAESGAPSAGKSTAKPAVAESASVAAAAVTVSGCLELDDATFWLKDVSGTDMQASRSWRSGFLKKRSPRVEIFDAANTLKLQNHVGQRVSATGILMDRQMQARSLRRIAASCS